MKSKIILPLYIYPHPGAWDPLYAAYVSQIHSFTHGLIGGSISAHPDLEFLVIVNPNSGPGAPPWWPNEDYVREIPRLNASRNVTTVGYVRTTYCRRPVEDVVQDIEVYAKRNNVFAGLQVHGIFVDETVNLYSKEAKHYLDRIDHTVKGSAGIHGNRIVLPSTVSRLIPNKVELIQE